MENESPKLNLVIAMLAGLLVLATLAVVVILKGGTDSLKEFSQFVVLLVPLMLGGLFYSNARQNEEIRSDVSKVHKKVNGDLDAKFKAIHDRLTLAAVPTLDEYDAKHDETA